jgi:outer membrane scaffolding protein for murein synthesis (MipA/OmpV family)
MPRSSLCPSALLIVLTALAAPLHAQQMPPPGWSTQLGVGLIANPEFQGSEDYQLIPIPYFDVRYRDEKGDLLFANVPQGIGGWLYRDRQPNGRRFDVGLGIAPGFATRDDEIPGLEEIDIATEARLYVSGGTPRWNASLTLAQDLGTGHEGAWIDLAVARRGRIGRAGFWSFGPTLRFADEDFSDAQYGVSALESVASGLAPHDAGQGLVSAGVQGLVSRPIGKSRWRWTGILSVNGLTGDRGDSPIVERRTQAFALMAVTRPFGGAAARQGGPR